MKIVPIFIKTIQEVQEHLPVNMTSDFDTVSPFIRSAETAYIVRLIGQLQVDDLKTYYDGEDTGNDDKNLAIGYIQKVITNLGYYLAVPILNVNIGASGIQISTNENNKQAFQWQVNDVKEAFQTLGLAALEELLVFLEQNAETFDKYAESDEYKKQKQLLITTAVDFSQYYEIGDSRLIYQSVAYLVKRVEDQQIAKVIGVEFLQSLKAGGLTEKKQYLVNNYLKPGIALLTIAKALMERVISLDNGRVSFNFKGRTENMRESQAASNAQIADSYRQLTEDGSMYIQDGLQYILNNLGDMDEFVAPVARRRFKVNNDPCKGVFVP